MSFYRCEFAMRDIGIQVRSWLSLLIQKRDGVDDDSED